MRKVKEIVKKVKDRLNKMGQEIPDPTPVAMPIGYIRPPTLAESIARIIGHHEHQKAIQAAGYETFEEAHDFDDPNDDYGDEWGHDSPYEEGYDGEFDHEIELEREHFEQKGKERTRKAQKQEKKPAASKKAAAKAPEEPPSDEEEN